MLGRYALRNVWRRPSRTALTTAAVGLAVALIIVGNTLIDGLQRHIIDEYTVDTGHVRLRHPLYDKESRFQPLDYRVDRVAERSAQLSEVPGVLAVHPRIRLAVMLQHTDTSTIVPEQGLTEEQEEALTDEQIFGRKVLEFAMGVAVDTERERSRSRLPKKLVAGRYFSPNPNGEILIGVELARRLQVRPGDELELVTFYEGIADAPIRVQGIFDAHNEIANRACHMSLQTAYRLLGFSDEVTELLVFTDSFRTSEPVRIAVSESPASGGLRITEWNQIGVMKLIAQLFGVVFGALLLTIVIAAAAGLLNTMLMNVYERRREIGVLQALGVKRRQILQTILIEAVAFALVGGLLGAATGIGGAWYLVAHGIELGRDATRSLPMPVADVVHGHLSAATVVRAVGVGVITSLLGAFWPARQATRLDPIEAMRRR